MSASSVTLPRQNISWLVNADYGTFVLLRVDPSPAEGFVTLTKVSQEKLDEFHSHWDDEREGIIEITFQKYSGHHPGSGIMQKILLPKETVYSGIAENIIDDHILKAFHLIRDLRPSSVTKE